MTEKNIENGLLSQEDVITKALEIKGAELDILKSENRFCHSKPIFSFELDRRTIAAFRQAGFKVKLPEKEGDKTRLVYRLNKSSYHCNFAPGEKVELTLSTYRLADYQKGIIFVPTIGRIIEWPDDYQPGLLAFCLAASNFENDVPMVVKEIAKQKRGKLVIKWSEIGLEGIKLIEQLWAESSEDYPSRKYLPLTDIINPNPEPITMGWKSDLAVARFVKKEFQDNVVDAWERQIIAFANGLQ